MKKLIGLTVLLMLAGCGDGQANREKVLRRVISDTNAALTLQAERADQYQKGYERLVRKNRKLHKKVSH